MLKIGTVSFLNSFPFQYGLVNISEFQTVNMVPSAITAALEENSIDIGLVPVASFIEHPEWQIVSDFCIGAVGEVKTVLLVSQKPIQEIKTISYDPDSRSSNMLTKVLAQHYWHISPMEVEANADARVMIGDKTFCNIPSEYIYRYDLSLEWSAFQQLPFVFALWVANKPISEEVATQLNQLFEDGVAHISETVNYFKSKLPIPEAAAFDYLTQNISFPLDHNKKMAIQRFKELVREL